MKLISIGRSPQVALSPPPTVTCDMVATLARWLERDVQPLARKHLGAPIVPHRDHELLFLPQRLRPRPRQG